MSRTNFQELLDAGVHFGHLARKWNPKMAPYIFDQKNGIHIIDLHKTVVKVDEAAEVMKELAKSGRKILFVATKKQAKDIVSEKAAEVNMPSIREALEHMEPQKANMILAQDYKDPTIALIISAIIGAYGIDRFYIGDTMMGILKLLTAGGCGIWWIIDIFLIMGATKEKNYQKFVQSASYM